MKYPRFLVVAVVAGLGAICDPDPVLAAPAPKSRRPAAAAVGIRPGCALVETATGRVTSRRYEKAVPVAVRAGMQIPDSSVITTGDNGRVFLRFSATDVIRVSPRSSVKLTLIKAPSLPLRPMTVIGIAFGRVRAILRRAAPSAVPDFAITSGSSVCAVKGTDFEVRAVRPLRGEPAVSLRVDRGTVLMLDAPAALHTGFGIDCDDLIHAVARGSAGVEVGAGQETIAEPGGSAPWPKAVQARRALELVTVAPGARVLLTIDGVLREAAPGDEVPPGSLVQVAGGPAVFSSGGVAVAAGDGSAFTWTAGAAPGPAGGLAAVLVVAAGSASGVRVEAGGMTVAVPPGSGVVTGGAGGPAVMSADAAAMAADGMNAPGVPAAVVGSVPAAGTLSPPPPPPDDLLPGGDTPIPSLPVISSDGAAPAPGDDDAPPPPPPDTVNQDTTTVSPAAP